MTKYSLRQFLFLWISIFIVSILFFLYLILNSFFSDYINQSSVKDLKHSEHLLKTEVDRHMDQLKNSLALHVSSRAFVLALKTKDLEKVKALTQNWTQVDSSHRFSIFDSKGYKLDINKLTRSEEGLKLSEKQIKGLSFGYGLFDYEAGGDGLFLKGLRVIYDFESRALGYLYEEKSLLYSELMASSLVRDFAFFQNKKLKFVSFPVQNLEGRLSSFLNPNYKAFEIKIADKTYDASRVDIDDAIKILIFKANLRSEVFMSFYKKYLGYFVAYLVFIILLFYLSYYRQIFRPIQLMYESLNTDSDLVKNENFSVREIDKVVEAVEVKISSLNKNLEHTKKTSEEGMGRLVANVAHELNNSLVSLGGNLEFLKDEVQEKEMDLEEVQTSLASAQKGYQRICKIVSDLKVFSSKTVLDVQNFKISNLEEILKSDFPDVSYKIDLSGEESFRADLDRLKQVILNLIKNAKQAYPLEEVDKKVEVSLYKNDGKIYIDIMDWGSGISSNAKDKIFAPFFTTKKNQEGMGLGLALSRDLISRMGGELFLKDTSSRGTTFCITLKQC